MWKSLKIGSRLKHGDQQPVPGGYAPIPLERIGTTVTSADGIIQRWIRPPGRKFRHDEETKRLTIRVPKSLYPLIPGAKGTWASDRVIEALKGGRF
jgi:hypothetical protein